MAWRKWLVRGLVFAALGAGVVGAAAYQAWTNPAAVRAQVLEHVRGRFAAGVASVSLESAQLRLLGGIAVSELRVARTDGLDRKDFLYVPSAVIYHDKERLGRGSFSIRKIEFRRPQLRVARGRDGRCNLSGLFAAADPHEPLPSVVVQQGTIVLEDQGAAPGSPVLEIKNVDLTAVEDPPGVVTVAGTGRTDAAGPIRFGAVVQRAGGDATFTLDADAVPVGPDLVQRLAGVCPDAAAQLRQLRGDGAVHASAAYHPADARPFTYDATCSLRHGAFSHARLPVPLEKLDADVRVVNGLIPVAHFAARSGAARFDLTLKDVTPTPTCPLLTASPQGNPDAFYDEVRELDLQMDDLPVALDLFDQMPEDVRKLRDLYRPTGPIHITHTFRRDTAGGWKKRWILRPDGMESEFCGFAYHVFGVKGVVDFEESNDKTMTADVDLTGHAGGRPVTLKGKVHGPAPTPAVDLDLVADDVPLDDKIFKALPESGQKAARQFLPERSRRLGLQAAPMGRADIHATIHREAGKDFANRFVVRFHDTSVKYDVFPLSLDGVSGELDLLPPNRWACRGFHGGHGGGGLRVEGRSYASPEGGGAQDRIYVTIDGDDVPVDDEEFKNALAPAGAPARLPLRRAWEALAVGGRMGFHAVVDESAAQPNDIDVAVSVHDCSLKPRFFTYGLDGFSGSVRYVRDHVYLADIKARHGASQLSLKEGSVVLRPGGGFQARLKAIRGAPLVPDAELLDALPDALRAGLRGLNLRGPLTATTDLVVDAAGDGEPTALWWDGSADLHDAAMRLGVDVTGLEGQAACCGLYNGRRLESLVGNVLLRRASVLGQPLENVHTRFEVQPGTPDVVRFRDLKADLFGGSLGGEGRVECGAGPRFDVTLKALQVDLREFARANNLGADAQMSGLASAAVHLTGDGPGVAGLKGNGRIDVPEGKMYRLPLQLDLLKALGLRLPDRTAFEQAHAVFAVDGPQLKVQNLDLFGNAVSLRGRGEVDLVGGDINLDFNADWGRLAQVLPAGVNEVPRAVSDQLLKIKMRGRPGDVHFEKELAPGVMDWFEGAAGP